MSVQNISTILILGATGGLGEAFTLYFHAQGKKVLAAGRNISKLASLKAELKGLETFRIDVEDIANLETNIQAVIKAFPDLDSVFVMSGIMKHFSFKDASTSSNESIVSEITTNLTAPLVIARVVVPHLLSLKRPTTFITVTSGLAYVPVPLYPVYNATKAGLHTATVVLRTQLADTNVNVIELAAPYIDTPLDADFREQTIALQGGKEHAMAPMPLKEYMEITTAQLEKGGLKEVSIGFAALGVTAWRNAFGPILEQFGMAG
jgi:short-subunit dehydrogenase involved in D-alanine esterification of teichoic acids